MDATNGMVSCAGDLSRRLVPASSRGAGTLAAVPHARRSDRGDRGSPYTRSGICALASCRGEHRRRPRRPCPGKRAEARSSRMYVYRLLHGQRRRRVGDVGARASVGYGRLPPGIDPSERRAPRSARSVVRPPLYYRTAARLTRGLP